MLKKHRRVGIYQLKVEIDSQQSLGSRISEGVVDLLFPGQSRGLFQQKRLQELTVDTALKNFLAKGYYPIERQKIREILQEKSLHQSGIVENRHKLKLSGIDSIFNARLQIRVIKEFLKARTILSFSGHLTSVENGMILASGSITREQEEIHESDITDMIDTWFSDLHNLSSQ